MPANVRTRAPDLPFSEEGSEQMLASYRSLIESIPGIVYTAELGAAGRWLYVSPQIETILGWSADEWCADPEMWFMRLHPEDREDAISDELNSRATGDQLTSEYRLVARDGRVIWFQDRASIVNDDQGDAAYFHGVMLDITERKRTEAELSDSLAEIREVQDALLRSHDQFQSVIDNSPSVIHAKDRSFKYLFVNRAFGRMYGVEPDTMAGCTDEAIVPLHVAGRTRQSDRRVLDSGEVVQEEDVVPRRDGDRTYLTQKFPLRDGQGDIYSVCTISTDITERKAREEELRTQFEWSVRVHDAVRNSQLVLYAQPIQDLRSGSIDQEELLVRMRGPGGRHLPPADFLPQAERFGLVTEIDRWVVAQAVKLSTVRDQKVEVNLSGKSIGDHALLELIEERLRAHDADPANVIFEITETAAAENMDAARDFAWRLKSMGCGFALDDFGTGYGSFTYLKHLPVDFIKIDLQFVRYLAVDPSDRKVVKSITAVAKNFGVRTIAEGVEHVATLELLRELDVDYAQGFLIGEPRPVEG